MVNATTGSAFPVVSPYFIEIKGLTKFNFHIGPNPGTTVVPTGYSCYIYGVNDPNVKILSCPQITAGVAAYVPVGQVNTAFPSPTAAGSDWFLLPAPSEQGGPETGVYANPLTAVNQSLYFQGLLTGLCVVIQQNTPAGTCTVWGTGTT
jgi:hypothetical protein